MSVENDTQGTQLLSIRLTLPIVDEDFTGRRGSLVFHRWMPASDEHSFTIEDEALKLKFFFDEECLDSLMRPIDLKEIHRYLDVIVGKMRVEITGIRVADRFVETITKLASENDWTPEHINSTY